MISPLAAANPPGHAQESPSRTVSALDTRSVRYPGRPLLGTSQMLAAG